MRGVKLCSELIHEYLRPEIPALGNDGGQWTSFGPIPPSFEN